MVHGCADGHVRATLEGLGEVGAPIVLVLPTVSRADVREAFTAGANGIVLEDTVEASLEPTLDAVLAGQLVLPPTGRGHLAPPVLSAPRSRCSASSSSASRMETSQRSSGIARPR